MFGNCLVPLQSMISYCKCPYGNYSQLLCIFSPIRNVLKDEKKHLQAVDLPQNLSGHLASLKRYGKKNLWVNRKEGVKTGLGSNFFWGDNLQVNLKLNGGSVVESSLKIHVIQVGELKNHPFFRRKNGPFLANRTKVETTGPR